MKTRSSIILALVIVTLLALVSVLPALAADTWTVNAALGDESGCVSPTFQCKTIGAAVSAAAAGDTINVLAGTYVLSAAVDVNKAGITLDGAGAGATIVQVSGTGPRFIISAPGVTLQDFEIVKTDKTGEQNIIQLVDGNNVTIKNNTIHGQFVIGDGEVSRAIIFNAGAFSGVNIEGNTIYALRQPAYISGTHTGTIQNNYVYGTKGWVLEGGNLTFTGNTWGTGANANVYDIAILALVGAGPYPDIVAMSNANNGAVIEDQRVSPAVLSVVYVDAATAYSSDLGGRYHPYSTITPAVARVVAGGTINVAAGTYDEDVTLNKSLSLLGAGAGSTTIRGVIGGDGTTVWIAASNVTIAGFTITRLGNNPTDWNGALNTAGIAVQGVGFTGMLVRDNTITGNRTGIDINNSSGHTIRNNVITDNRTGMVLRNQTDNLTVVENEITNNWTVGIVFLDASGGTNVPLQTALNCTFSNNKISGNWYGQIVDRQTGGSLPLPGANLKNFSGDWLGTTSPAITTANSTEPGYASQIPVAYGGTAVAPSGQPDIAGAASANIDFTPYLNSGTDSNIQTTPGRGTYGFQGDFSNLWATAAGAQTGATGRIQEGVNTVSGSTVNVAAGTYVEDLAINKAVTLLGPNAAINPNTGTRVAEAVLHPATSDPNPNSPTSEVMAYLSVSNVTIKGFTFDGDNPSLTSGIMIGTADVDASEILAGYEGMGNITVENNILKNSTYSGIDFYNYTNTAATSGNYIRYNRFEDIGETTYNWGLGVLIYNNFYADITNNVFTGVRTGIQTGNFSAANPGTTGSISNNQIGAWRLGIFHNLAYGSASALTLANNTITAENYPGATKWNGILLSSIGGTVNAIVSGNNIVIPGSVSYVAPGYTAGYNVWNVTTTAPTTISGGTVTGGDYGVWVNNFAGYISNANNTAITIDGVGISNAARAGIYVQDDALNTNGATVRATIQNSTISGSAVGILVDGTDASAIAHLNRISSNVAGVNNTTGVILPFDRNYWGTVDASGVAAAATGNVDYQPWCNADFSRCSYYASGTVSMQTSGSPTEVGGIVTMTSVITADGVYGMQLRVNFNPTELEFQTTGSSYHDVPAAGWYWDQVVENFTAVSGGRRLSSTMQDPPHANPATLTGQSVATWNFKCLQPGIFNLTYDATDGLGTYLATKDGFTIPATLVNGQVTCLAATASVDGYIKLQGRMGTNANPAAWQGAQVTLTCVSGGCVGYGGPYTMTTDDSGHYQWLKTAAPGSGVVLGTYSATVQRRAYLGATKGGNVTIVAGTNPINIGSTAPTLLGGDVVAGGGIDIGDLTALGGAFGTPVAADTGNDVNGDGYVNIFDLVMAGGNFYKTTSVWTP